MAEQKTEDQVLHVVECPICRRDVSLRGATMVQHFYDVTRTHRVECVGSLKTWQEAADYRYEQ